MDILSEAFVVEKVGMQQWYFVLSPIVKRRYDASPSVLALEHVKIWLLVGKGEDEIFWKSLEFRKVGGSINHGIFPADDELYSL